MKPIRLISSGLVLTGVALTGAAVWQAKCNASKSPPAASAMSASAHARIVAEGRVVTYPGAQVQIGVEAGGLITRLPIEENQTLEQGALVAELKSDDLRASLNEAKARVNELDAEHKLAEAQRSRHRKLNEMSVLSVEESERTERDLDVVLARRAAALATVTRFEAEIAKTRILAPFKGTVLRRHVEPGEVISEHATLATLADLNRVRVEAEVDEYDAGRVQKGASVKITAEGFPGESWKGVVEEVPELVVEKGLQPRDPSRPVDVRVLRAKIAMTSATPLKLGQRVEIEISVADSALARQP